MGGREGGERRKGEGGEKGKSQGKSFFLYSLFLFSPSLQTWTNLLFFLLLITETWASKSGIVFRAVGTSNEAHCLEPRQPAVNRHKLASMKDLTATLCHILMAQRPCTVFIRMYL